MANIQAARDDGVDVAADVYPFDTGPGFATAFLPAWAIEGGPDETLRRLRDPETRARLLTDNDRYWRFAAAGAWDRVTLVYSTAHPDWAGNQIATLGDELGVPPYEVMLRLFEDEGAGMGRITINGVIFPEDHVRECLTHPLFSIGSDGWRGTRDGGEGEVALHPNSWGWVPLVLGHYVRETGVLTLEDAMWKMTGYSAERLGLDDRYVWLTQHAQASSHPPRHVFTSRSDLHRAGGRDPRCEHDLHSEDGENKRNRHLQTHIDDKPR